MDSFNLKKNDTEFIYIIGNMDQNENFKIVTSDDIKTHNMKHIIKI